MTKKKKKKLVNKGVKLNIIRTNTHRQQENRNKKVNRKRKFVEMNFCQLHQISKCVLQICTQTHKYTYLLEMHTKKFQLEIGMLFLLRLINLIVERSSQGKITKTL